MKTSKCCGAKIILTDICSECKEHAEKENKTMKMSTYISPQSLINLYIRLIKQGRLKKDGAGFKRLNQLLQNRGKK
jgi:hypothetical protein